MRNGLALLLTALLVLLAIFLPEYLSRKGDETLFDRLYVETEAGADQMSFSESMEPAVAEKLLLLRTGELIPLRLPGEESEFRVVLLPGGEAAIYESEEPTLKETVTQEQADWNRRLSDVLPELQILQKLGAIPLVYTEGETVELTGKSQIWYMSREGGTGFLLNYMEIACGGYVLDLTTDSDTGKILGFAIRWGKKAPPSWGASGAANFGAAWRDYWGMDSVDAAWNSDRVKEILTNTEKLFRPGGETYFASDLGFQSGGQTVRIPLYCRETGGGEIRSIQWNS